MQKNKQNLYDVVIIGASQEGIETALLLKHKIATIKVAIVSTAFDKLQPEYDLTGVEIIKARVIFSEYQYGLITLSLQTKAKIFCTNLIIASGTSLNQLTATRRDLSCFENVYYKLSDIPKIKLSKNNQIVVIGNSDEAVKAALIISQKLSYVYLCGTEQGLNCNKALASQLLKNKNIAYLPNSIITSYHANENKVITSLVLDTYNRVHCTGILILLGCHVDDSGITPQMVTKDESQHIIVNKNCQTTIIPSIYAIGSCCTKSSKAARLRMINLMIEKNKWETEKI